MKRAYTWLAKYIDARDTLAVIFCSVFTWHWSSRVKSIIIEILAGISIEDSVIEIVPLGKWLFLFAFYFFIICRKLSKDRRMMLLVLYRYRYFETWWKHHFITMHIANFIIFIISCVMWETLDMFNGNFTNENFAVILVFFLHLSAGASVLTAGDILLHTKIIPCILLIWEGMSYIAAVNFHLPFLVCGMYVNCSFRKLGIAAAAAYVTEIFITVICYLTVPELWKRGYLEREIAECQVQ